MAYPDTDWPTSIDAAVTRTDGVERVDAGDFNYPDGQILAIEGWLGVDEDLIGDDGAAAHGPGGLASPIADGGVAVTLAAKEDYTSGKLLSVGDDNDSSYSEKMSVDFSGRISSNGLNVTANGVLADPGHVDTVQTVTSSSNEISVDCQDGLVVYHELTENTEFLAPTNPTNGAELTFIIKGSGSYTVTWDTNGSGKYWWESAFPMTIPTGDHLVAKFIYESTLGGWIEEWANLVDTSAPM